MWSIRGRASGWWNERPYCPANSERPAPNWRAWSCLARYIVGVVHVALKQSMKAAENQKQPIAVTHLLHESTVANEMDQELQHFVILWTEGTALEFVRGAERELGLEHW